MAPCELPNGTPPRVSGEEAVVVEGSVQERKAETDLELSLLEGDAQEGASEQNAQCYDCVLV